MSQRSQRGPAAANSTASHSPAASENLLPTLAERLWLGSGCLLGAALVWAFLQPLDATSVYAGDAQPQNLLWLALGLCAAAAVACRGQGMAIGNWSLGVALACGGWLLVGTLQAGQENNPRTAWFGLWHCLGLVSCYLAARGLLVGPRSRAVALGLCVLGCYALAAHGLIQVTIGFPMDRAAYEADPEGMLRASGLDAPVGSPVRKRFEDRLYSPEPYATFALANSLGTVLSAAVVLLVGASLVLARRETVTTARINQATWWILLATTLLLLATWLLTRSRTAYLAVTCVGLWGILQTAVNLRQAGVKWNLRRVGAGGALVLAIAGGLLWLLGKDRLVLMEAPKSIAFRLEYWLATTNMIVEHGWFGVGLGNFQSYYPRYMFATASETIADPHNFLLDIAATLSWPVAVSVAAWLGYTLLGPLPDEASATKPESAAADRQDAMAARCLWVGAAVGGGLGWLGLTLLGLLDGAAVGAAWLVALLCGVGTWPAIQRLAAHGPWLIRLSAVAVVLCLLANGSWQASGIALPWLMLVLCSIRPMAQIATAGGKRWAVCLLPLVGGVCFIFQSWLPVTRSWALLQQAAVATSPNAQLAIARQAVVADPLDSDRRQFLTQILAAEAVASPAAIFSRKVEGVLASLQDWLRSDSAKSLNWQFAGDQLLNLAARQAAVGGSPLALEQQAEAYYREAVDRYPVSVQLRVQLAAAAMLAGDTAVARQELAQALRLSDLTPHADKQVATQVVWLPRLPPGMPASVTTPGWVPAEPVVDWLRTTRE